MNFADFLCPDAILPDLQATDRTGVIREMTQALLDAGQVAKEEHESQRGAYCGKHDPAPFRYLLGNRIRSCRASGSATGDFRR